MIELYCQHCGHHLKILDKYAGQSGTCKNCGKSILVPAVGFEPDPTPAPVQKTNDIPYKWIGATAAVVALLALGIGAYLKKDGAALTPPQTVATDSLLTVSEIAQISSEDEVALSAPSFEVETSLISKALRERIEPLLPTEEENRFRLIPWRTDLLRARREANEKGKPIFMWLMAGNPLGCT